MKRLIFPGALLFILWAATGEACGALPDLPRQELWVKIISLLAGLIVIFTLCVFALNRILYGPFGMEAELSARLSLIVAVIISFLWFLYLFGQIFSTTITIAVSALGIILVIVLFLKGGDGPGGSGGDDAGYGDDYQY